MARAPIPLTLRTPNPPPTFVGREREAARLAERLRTAPATIVHGPEGVGKRALALHVLHRRFKSRLDGSIYVQLAPSAPVAVGVADALAKLGAAPSPGASAREEVALELAEASRVWVLIDGGEDPAWRLAHLVARYARASRWLFLTRERPPEALLECALGVDALPVADLAELAGRWHPDLPERERALVAEVANGSPWRLRGIVADRRYGTRGAASEDDPATAAALDALVATELALPAALLATAAGTTTAMLDRLVDRGLVARHPGGFVVPGSARALLGPRPLSVAAAERLVHGLVHSGEPSMIVEGIRIALATNVALAGQLLAEHGDRVFATSAVPPLARQLIASPARELAHWRLRAAVELGDGDALRELAGDVPPSDRLLWAEGLVRAGKLADAIAAVRTPPTSAEGCLIAARAHGTLGEFGAGLAQIATLRTHAGRTASLDAHASSLAARLAALAGEATRARDELARIGDVEDLPPAHTLEVLIAIASASHEIGDLAGADTALARIARRTDTDPSGRFLERRSALLRAAIQIDRGELGAAAATLDRLEAATSQRSAHRPFLALLAAHHALVRGDARATVAAIERAGTSLDESHYLSAWAAALVARARIVDPSLPPRSIPEATGLWPAVARIHHARVELRAGRAQEAPALADPPFEAWIAARAFAWEQALVRGDAEASHRAALDAADRAASAGFAAWEREAIAGMIDAALVMRDEHALRTAVARRAALGLRFDGDGPEDASLGDRSIVELEQIAAGAPSARARRARWMLGSPAEADALDLVVCAATGSPRARTIAGALGPWRAGWGIDREARSVWRPESEPVSFADKPQLWRLLLALVDAPLGLAKEALVTQTWGGPYHPMHHDKRLQNAVHKIRRLVETDPARPSRIATTPEGYQIGTAEPARLAPP